MSKLKRLLVTVLSVGWLPVWFMVECGFNYGMYKFELGCYNYRFICKGILRFYSPLGFYKQTTIILTSTCK